MYSGPQAIEVTVKMAKHNTTQIACVYLTRRSITSSWRLSAGPRMSLGEVVTRLRQRLKGVTAESTITSLTSQLNKTNTAYLAMIPKFKLGHRYRARFGKERKDIEAETFSEAKRAAWLWAIGHGMPRVIKRFSVTPIVEIAEAEIEVELTSHREQFEVFRYEHLAEIQPYCYDGAGHSWKAPDLIVGAETTGSGLVVCHDTHRIIRTVCAQCGVHKTITHDSTGIEKDHVAYCSPEEIPPELYYR